jgi:hypothetical protein
VAASALVGDGGWLVNRWDKMALALKILKKLGAPFALGFALFQPGILQGASGACACIAHPLPQKDTYQSLIFSPWDATRLWLLPVYGMPMEFNSADSTWRPLDSLLGEAAKGSIARNGLSVDPKDPDTLWISNSATGLWRVSRKTGKAVLQSNVDIFPYPGGATLTLPETDGTWIGSTQGLGYVPRGGTSITAIAEFKGIWINSMNRQGADLVVNHRYFLRPDGHPRVTQVGPLQGAEGLKQRDLNGASISVSWDSMISRQSPGSRVEEILVAVGNGCRDFEVNQGVLWVLGPENLFALPTGGIEGCWVSRKDFEASQVKPGPTIRTAGDAPELWAVLKALAGNGQEEAQRGLAESGLFKPEVLAAAGALASASDDAKAKNLAYFFLMAQNFELQEADEAAGFAGHLEKDPAMKELHKSDIEGVKRVEKMLAQVAASGAKPDEAAFKAAQIWNNAPVLSWNEWHIHQENERVYDRFVNFLKDFPQSAWADSAAMEILQQGERVHEDGEVTLDCVQNYENFLKDYPRSQWRAKAESEIAIHFLSVVEEEDESGRTSAGGDEDLRQVVEWTAKSREDAVLPEDKKEVQYLLTAITKAETHRALRLGLAVDEHQASVLVLTFSNTGKAALTLEAGNLRLMTVIGLQCREKAIKRDLKFAEDLSVAPHSPSGDIILKSGETYVFSIDLKGKYPGRLEGGRPIFGQHKFDCPTGDYTAFARYEDRVRDRLVAAEPLHFHLNP